MNPVVLVLTARFVRGLADGMMVVGLPLYFAAIGFSVSDVGLLATVFQLGTVVALIWAGQLSRGRGPGLSLMLCSVLMFVAALGFMWTREFSWVVFFALLGAINPIAIDATVFRPLEQGALLQVSPAAQHPGLVAVHSFLGQISGAVGALLVAAPSALRDVWHIDVPDTAIFGLTAALVVPLLLIYFRLARLQAAPQAAEAPQPKAAKPPSPKRLRTLMSLFAVDALAGGMFANTLVLVWMHQRFELQDSILGILFFAISIGTALMQFLSIPLVKRVGLVWGIILPNALASTLMILLALAPTPELALGIYFVRTIVSVLDVPARSALVVQHDAPKQFAFSLSATTLVMSVAGALGSLVAAGIFSWSLFGWPLIIGGVMRYGYAGLLYALDRRGLL